MAKKFWIQDAIKKPGSLTAQAKRAGKTVSEFSTKPPKNISLTTKKRISLTKTLKKFNGKGGMATCKNCGGKGCSSCMGKGGCGKKY